MNSESGAAANGTERKIVDLIYLDKPQNPADLLKEYRSRIDVWLTWMNQKLEWIAAGKIDGEEQDEYFVVNNYLRNFLLARLEWIGKSVEDRELQMLYLLVLPPFNAQGNIKSFLLHFFKLEERESGQKPVFIPLDQSEREVRILWDLYKLNKTLETIQVLKNSVKGPHPFVSRFDGSYITKTLNTVWDLITLLIKICVKPEAYDEIRYHFPPGVFLPETILNRKESGNYLINDVALEKFDYRNYFFHLYYRSSLKAAYKRKDLGFRFNYLDFEIMRQEFLMHWLSRRLRNNPKKAEVYRNYKMGNRRFSDIVQRSPDMEITLLRQLPVPVFNDLVAAVDDTVDTAEKAEINPLSENRGEFSSQFKLFSKAKEISKKTVEAIRSYMSVLTEPKTRTDSVPPEEDATFQIKRLKSMELDFPFFVRDVGHHESFITSLLPAIISADYHDFSNDVVEFILNASDDALMKRMTPKHEWVLPFLVKEINALGKSMQLLVVGVEAIGDPNEIEFKEDYQFRPYFVYGSKVRNFELGDPIETRQVMGKPFFIYQPNQTIVIHKALRLLKAILAQEI